PGRPSYFVSDFTAAEIRTLDAGSWYAAELRKPPARRQPFLRSLNRQEMRQFVSKDELAHYKSGEVRHPTLRETLDLARRRGLLVNIEIKALPRLYPGITAKVVRLVRELGTEREVILSSFDHEQLAEVRRLSKRIATAALTPYRLHDPGRYVRDLLDG